MEIRNLATTALSDIVQGITTSFADYFVPLPADVSYWENRFKIARVDFSLSFGMFEGPTLLGFFINGIDETGGVLTAFNTGTGVIPPARGYKVVDQLYAHALPLFRAAGIQRCALEVIEQNDRAIRVYERIGFGITRTLRCFKGSLQLPEEGVQAEVVPFSAIATAVAAADSFYSWDHSSRAMQASGSMYQCYKVKDKTGQEAGYFIINPANGQLAQIEGYTDTAAATVLQGVASVAPVVKINNVDSGRTAIIETFHKAGLENFINQYEMQMELT